MIVLEPGERFGHASAMDPVPPPLAFFCLLFAGWVNRQQQAVIDYLLEENRVLRAAHGSRRVRFTDDQRRRLAVKGKSSAGVVSRLSPASSPRIRSCGGSARCPSLSRITIARGTTKVWTTR